MRPVAVAVLSLLIIGGPAHAQGRMVLGNGISSCGTWTKERQTDAVNSALLTQWVAGFLSGMNVPNATDVLVDKDYDGLMGWIDNYCRANPLNSVGIASAALMYELRSRQH